MSPDLFEFVQASPNHIIGKVFEWQDQGVFGSKTKRYQVTLRFLNKQEAQRLFPGRTIFYDENYVIGFGGDLPASVQKHFSKEELARGYSDPGMNAEGFMRRIDDLTGRYYSWADTSGWHPL